MEENKQIDITKLTPVELYKLAFEQQQVVTNLLAQIQQTQANIAALQAEIAKRPEDK